MKRQAGRAIESAYLPFVTLWAVASCPFASQVRGQYAEVKLTASDGSRLDSFGGAVPIDGDVAVIGAAFDDDSCTGFPQDCGAAYVFRRVGSNWIEEQKLVASDPLDGDLFGWDVAVSGGTIMVSALTSDTGWPNDGSVYVFEWDGIAWVERQKLLASDAIPGWEFGQSIALQEDVAAIGQFGDPSYGLSARGAVYVFRRQGPTWVQEQKLVPPDLSPYDAFGHSVAMSGNVIVGTAPEHGPEGAAGAA